MNKQCQKCNELFECNTDDIKSCFCFKIKLTPAQLQDLSAKFDNCLCPKCLKKYAKDSDQEATTK